MANMQGTGGKVTCGPRMRRSTTGFYKSHNHTSHGFPFWLMAIPSLSLIRTKLLALSLSLLYLSHSTYSPLENYSNTVYIGPPCPPLQNPHGTTPHCCHRCSKQSHEGIALHCVGGTGYSLTSWPLALWPL